MGYSEETWYVRSSGLKYYQCVLLLTRRYPILHIFSDWLITKKKMQYEELCMGCSDETWYVGRSGLKYHSCTECSNQYLICLFVLIG